MAEDSEALREEMTEKLYFFVADQIRSGADKARIVEGMVEMGVDQESAVPLADTLYSNVIATAARQRLAPGDFLPALLGAVAAAVVGGVVWGIVAITTGYELGYLAWGIGFLCGSAVVLFSKGKRGVPLQVTAVLSSLQGIFIGKYLTFYFVLMQAVEKEYGADATGNLSIFAEPVFRFFVLNVFSMLSAFDVLWVIVAVLSAWRIPMGLGVRPPAHPVA